MAETAAKETYWIRCPICQGKTRIKVFEDSVLIKLPLYCPKCKHITRVDVVDRMLAYHHESNF